MDWIGNVVADRYRIVGELGSGGMGKVFLVEDLKLVGKRWALKRTYHSKDTAFEEEDEAKILIRLHHPQLPHIVDYIPEDEQGCSYVVMEYIPGRTLQEEFELSGRRMPVAKVLKYAVQIGDLLDYLHRANSDPIIYRDLKPANLLVDETDNIRLIDFGIARAYKQGQTQDTVPLGTVGFAAPEQFGSGQSDERSDLYSLGALLYFLVSGGQYFYVRRESLRTAAPEVSSSLSSIVDRLLQDDPAVRYGSAGEVKKELAWVRGELSGETDDELEGDAWHVRKSEGQVTARFLANQTIVICSMYPGAGSTFVTLAMAGWLRRAKAPHAVIESSSNMPELYQLLDGEKRAPRDYVFACDRLDGFEKLARGSEWKDGDTLWFPLNPELDALNSSTEDHLKLLYQVKSPIRLIDVSHHWDETEAQGLLASADHIVVVADSLPSKFSSSKQAAFAQKYREWRVAGISVRFVANRDAKFNGRREWVHSFPETPSCYVPMVSYEHIIASAWRGELPLDSPNIREPVEQAVVPLMKLLFPDIAVSLQHQKRSGNWLRKKVLAKWMRMIV